MSMGATNQSRTHSTSRTSPGVTADHRPDVNHIMLERRGSPFAAHACRTKAATPLCHLTSLIPIRPALVDRYPYNGHISSMRYKDSLVARQWSPKGWGDIVGGEVAARKGCEASLWPYSWANMSHTARKRRNNRADDSLIDQTPSGLQA
jgi:hypothetical protein